MLPISQGLSAGPPAAPARLRWRVFVRTGRGALDAARPARPLAWHLTSCADAEALDAHCEIGRPLVAANDDPDGHCLVDGACPRCALELQELVD